MAVPTLPAPMAPEMAVAVIHKEEWRLPHA